MTAPLAAIASSADADLAAPVPGVLLDTVEPRAVEWLWPGYLPLGMLSFLDGDPSRGKSQVTLDLAARLSRGWPMPYGDWCLDPAGTVILSAEDDLAATVRPRLDAAGADCARIRAIVTVGAAGRERLPNLADDLDSIRAALESVRARLVIIDPISAYLGRDVDSHRDADVRRVLHPLARLAQETGAAVLCVRHLSKSHGTNALYAGAGSIAFTGAARSALLVAADPGDPNRSVLAVAKCNLHAKAPSLGFHVETVGESSRVVWDGEADHDAAALLDEGSHGALREAADTLREVLSDGPLPANAVKKQLEERGVAARTMWRAKKSLGVEAVKEGMEGGWVWSLPETGTPPVNPIGTLGTLRPPWHTSADDPVPFDDDDECEIEEITT